jgi:holo-[acyl-carrier protein] synthase
VSGAIEGQRSGDIGVDVGGARAPAAIDEITGIGVDLARIPRLRRVLERWDERFLRRVFTEQEIAYCRGRRDPVPHLAARFAAKEAALKALGTGLRMGVSWRELEVRRERGAAPTLVLSGRTGALARAKGTSRVLLSLTHDGDYALAQVVLLGRAAGSGAVRSEAPGSRAFGSEALGSGAFGSAGREAHITPADRGGASDERARRG